jgi:hypothetical protein
MESADKMYCFVGDLLGFKSLLLNLPPEEQAVRVEEWIRLAEEGAERYRLRHFHLVSDTVFAGGENSKEGLERLMDYSRYMLETGIRNAFPLRGAIAFGDTIWHPKVTFGEAIARAYDFANSQNWIGTSCIAPLPHIDLLWDSGKILWYAPQTKQDDWSQMPVISWQVPTFDELFKNTARKGLTNTRHVATQHHMEIVNNTILFSLYQKRLKESEEKIKPRKIDRSKIYYFTSTQMLDSEKDLFVEEQNIFHDPTVPRYHTVR